MKEYNAVVVCKCGAQQNIKFRARPSFTFILLPHECTICGSDLGIKVKPGLFKRQIQTQVVLVQHTPELLDMINRRENAQNHSQG